MICDKCKKDIESMVFSIKNIKLCGDCFMEKTAIIPEDWRIVKSVIDNSLVWCETDVL